MARTIWSRWTVLLLALVASLTSPALALAHGVAHAHGAHGIRGYRHGEAPPHETVDGHDAAHAAEHDLAHEHETAPPRGRNGAALRDQHHGHRHIHVRVELGATVKLDVRSEFETLVIVCAGPPVLPLSTHAQSPVSRWDVVALARPAPNTGPPPALRAPPTC